MNFLLHSKNSLLPAGPLGRMKMRLADKLAKLRIEVTHNLLPCKFPLDEAWRPSHHAGRLVGAGALNHHRNFPTAMFYG